MVVGQFEINRMALARACFGAAAARESLLSGGVSVKELDDMVGSCSRQPS